MKRRSAVLVASLLTVASWAGAAPIELGAPAPALALRNQHDQPVAITRDTAFVVFAAERAVSDWVNKTFAVQGEEALLAARVVYVADISSMPTLITNTFALPKWKQLPFAIGLAREAAPVADLPRKPGHATVLTLKDGVVTQLRFAPDGTQLQQWLGWSPPR